MRNIGIAVLLLGLAVACSRAHLQTAQPASTCTVADKARLNDLERAMQDSARIAELERVSADTATTGALSRVLADTARMADLRRLVLDSTRNAQHEPQVDALLGELSRFSRCAR